MLLKNQQKTGHGQKHNLLSGVNNATWVIAFVGVDKAIPIVLNHLFAQKYFCLLQQSIREKNSKEVVVEFYLSIVW